MTSGYWDFELMTKKKYIYIYIACLARNPSQEACSGCIDIE